MDPEKKLDSPRYRPPDAKRPKSTPAHSSRPLLTRGSFWAAIVAIATLGILFFTAIGYYRDIRKDRRKVDKLINEALIKIDQNPDTIEIGPNCDPPEGEDRMRLGDAKILIDDAASLAPSYHRVLTAKGIYHLKLCEDSAAEELFREAIRQDKNYAPAHYDLGVIYYRRQRFDAAIEQYKIAAQLDPEDARPLVNLGMLHRDREDYAEALPPLERASELKPGDSEIWELLGIAYYKTERWTQALLSLRRAIDLNNNSFSSHYYIGVTYREAGNHAEAVTHLRIARELQPEDKRPYPALGDSLIRLGNLEDAKTVLTVCIETWPDFSDCNERLEGFPVSVEQNT